MKKIIAMILAGMMVMPLFNGCAKVDDTPPADEKIDTTEEVTALRQKVWDEYVAQINEKYPSRATELQKNEITYIQIGRIKMKVQTKVVGREPEGGYPLFLIYHGGGTDPTGEMNESQWSTMADRYTTTYERGIYCSIRSVSDDAFGGQIFSTIVSWKFYDRIIEDAILYLNANPNKVYIVGYSAGGNGVYQIAPRITDRLASATMTAGHPEWIDVTNLRNLPFFLQVGELDDAYKRNTVTVEYSQKLDALAEQYGGGYEHYCYVHADKVHGVVGDNAKDEQTVIADVDAWLEAQQSGTAYTGGTVKENTHAAERMTEFTRDPLPTRVVWNLATNAESNSVREIESFYWLSSKAEEGIIDASYDKATNTVTIASCTATDEVTVYLNEQMVDLFKEVTVILPDGSQQTFTPEISEELLRKTTEERGDPNYQFCSSYTFKVN